MIFLGDFRHLQELDGQRHAKKKLRENVIKCKIKCFFSRAKALFSCQNARKEALFSVSTFFVGDPWPVNR
jgi:hypothetical protein